VNEILKSLHERKSTRVFEERRISPADKARILDAAIQAPSAGNQALYTILDIEDQGLKDRLAVFCDNQPFIARAPMVLVFLADCQRWLDAYRLAKVEARNPGAGDLVLACEDALVAAQNAVVAAESLGIGSCYIGDILENHERVVELLRLDGFVFPVTMLVLGYATEQQRNRLKPGRFDKKYLVQKDGYSRLEAEDLRNMFLDRHEGEAFDFEGYVGAFCKRKYMSDFALELNRSVSKYLERYLGWLPRMEG
jgi:nitroreductase